jgi:hypothetical protein
MKAIHLLFLYGLFVTSALAAENKALVEPVLCMPAPDQTSDTYRLLEAKCLQRLAALASRNGDALQLSLLNGRTKTFVDNNDACRRGDTSNCLVTTLSGYYPALQTFVLERSAYESRNVAYVSRRSGETITLDDYPHFSPSGKRFVAVAASEAWEVENDIALFSTEIDPPKPIWRYKAGKDYEMWNFVGWDGEDRIKLRVTMWVRKELKTLDADAVRTSKGWQLNKPKIDN